MLFFALANCPFGSLSNARLWIEKEHALAFAATDPIVDGHIVLGAAEARRHSLRAFPREQHALWALVSEVRSRMLTGLKPDTFSIGFNDTLHEGADADHAVVHVFPRRRGDNLELLADLEWVTDDNLAAAKK